MLLPYRPIKLQWLVRTWCCLCLYFYAGMAVASDKLNIFVSVLPQKYIVEQVGGEHVIVNAMVQPGYSPATYEPNPRQISRLAKADLYFRVGVPFEHSWMDRISAVNPGMPVVDARENLPLRILEEHNHGDSNEHAPHEDEPGSGTGHNEHGEHDRHDDGHVGKVHEGHHEAEHSKPIKDALLAGKDPHIWTSPRMASLMAEQVYIQLAALKPEHRGAFQANLKKFSEALEQLDRELSELFANTKQRKFMVFHPSWGYFADAYGLTQVSVEVDGKEPGAKTLAGLIKQARQEQIKTIFIQPQFDARIARQIAQAIEGNLVEIDPLAEDYLSNIRHSARQIAGIQGKDE